MAPTAIGSKAQGMGSSWAAASGVQQAGAYCVTTRTACFISETKSIDGIENQY